MEGDSAGGSAKQARDRDFSSCYAFRWQNTEYTWEVDTGEILSSQEVHNISIALGVEPGSNDLSTS